MAGCWARRARAGSGTARALQATGARACGVGGGRRAGHAAGARPGRWAPGLALGSALGALGPFSLRFDSFFPESPNEHCSL